ncbi:16256_t:CDS:2 [Gigaspora rosea]|nr:16256_t:CDS:2 [Gigaspora rosea]
MVNDQNHSYIDKHDSSSSTQIFGLDEQNAKLERELEDLDKCVDRDTVVDLIHEIVPLLLIIKRKGAEAIVMNCSEISMTNFPVIETISPTEKSSHDLFDEPKRFQYIVEKTFSEN